MSIEAIIHFGIVLEDRILNSWNLSEEERDFINANLWSSFCIYRKLLLKGKVEKYTEPCSMAESRRTASSLGLEKTTSIFHLISQSQDSSIKALVIKFPLDVPSLGRFYILPEWNDSHHTMAIDNYRAEFTELFQELELISIKPEIFISFKERERSRE